MKKLNTKLFILPAVVMALAFAPDNNKPIDASSFNKSVRPQDDFYSYVNSKWIDAHPVPKTEASWGTFNELDEKSKNAIHKIVEDAAAMKNAPANSNTQRIGDFYAAGMDTNAIEKAGFAPLKEEFAKIDAMQSGKELWKVLAEQHMIQVNSGFAFIVTADFKNSAMNVPYIFQGGTVLPDREYYKAEETAALRDAYLKHLTNMFVLMGDEAGTAATNAKAVMKIETMFADSSMSAVEQRDIEKQYNKMKLPDIIRLCPNFQWEMYFRTIGATDLNEIIVGQPAFLRQLNSMVEKITTEEWRAYLRWQLVHSVAGKLHKAVVNENFYFFGTVLSGVEQQQPRWKRVLSTTEGALGDALGQEYVKTYFSPESKQRVNTMVDNLMAAYEDRLRSNTWMSDETKKKAIEKLHAITRKLGYPDKWRDYTGLEIKRDSYVSNFLRSNRFDFKWLLGKMNKPVDKTEWGMTPQTVNAYYNPSANEIVFPAAIMQPPFFDPNADDAVNYGSMGAVIGHELTHGFDDQGSMFDAVGNLSNWWTEKDRENFNQRTGKLVSQFNEYSPLENVHVNGELTLGENIADLGGLTMAYYALKKSFVGKPEPKPIDGLTAEQRFFIAWAQGWRNSSKPEALQMMVKTNPHSPAQFRVLGPLSNLPEFYEAFDVKAGDKMYRKPEDRVIIW